MNYEAFINHNPNKFLEGVTKVHIEYEGGTKTYDASELNTIQIVEVKDIERENSTEISNPT